MKSINGYVVGFAAVIALATSGTAGAQSLTPPVPGMVAVDGQVRQEGAGVEAVVGKAAQGVGHAFGFTKRLFVHSRTKKDGDSQQSARSTGSVPGEVDTDGASTAAAPRTAN